MNKNQLKFKIKQIEIIEFALKDAGKVITKDTVFRFETKIKHIIDAEKKVIDVIPDFNIYCDGSNYEIANTQVAVSFLLENIKEYFDQNGKLELPLQFIQMLNSLSISTCRGIMFALFKGTHLHSVILPIINPSNLTEIEQPNN